MRKLIVIAGSIMVLGAGMAHAQEGTLGGTTAAMGGSAALSGGGSASFGNAMNRARGVNGGSGLDDGSDMDSAMNGAMGGLNRGRGGSMSGMMGDAGSSAQATAALTPKRSPLLYGNETGETLLSELLRGGTGSVPRARRASLRRSRNNPLAKYKLPARGYLAYYLPADRYKVASSDWRYVAIEDDAARYPARYYYAPSAPNFLQLIAQPALGARIRGNRSARVIGFHTWQDALAAGYRPDPTSKPAPGAQLARLATSGRSTQLARYLGFVYAGQVPVSSFDATYSYALTVQRIANSRRDTRRFAGQAVGQVLLASLGEAPRPIAVGPFGVITSRPPAQNNQNNMRTGGSSFSTGRMGSSSSDLGGSPSLSSGAGRSFGLDSSNNSLGGRSGGR